MTSLPLAQAVPSPQRSDCAPLPLRIRAVTARTRFGHTIAPVLQALLASDDDRTSLPDGGGIDDFDIAAELGPKGVRTIDRATALALSALDAVMRASGGHPATDETALILGTSMGSAASTIRFTQDGLTGSRPYLVDPSRFPNTVMNFAAAQSAIRHSLTGPNATIIAGAVTGLTGVRYAARMIRGGQAEHALVGGTEELSAERQALHAASGAATTLGEGSAMLLVTSHDREPHAGPVIRGITTSFAPADDRGESVIGALIERALLQSNRTEAPHLLVVAGDEAGIARIRAGIRDRWPASTPTVLNIERVLGDIGAASASLALAVCAEAIRERVLGDDTDGWVLAADQSGYLGIATVSSS